ncbi:hypothetical protein SDC9_120142 [bioreactor metagenome]|uniref:Uncharacterized protein n=1 Tax=bioreactor metagenome TaxID=1076179 RepID=A0A645C5V8_9ZZZZ
MSRRGPLNLEDSTTLWGESSRTVEVSTLQRWRVVPSQEPGCIILLLTFQEPLGSRNFGNEIWQLDFQHPPHAHA